MDILKNKKNKKNIYFAKTLKKEICQIYERVRISNLKLIKLKNTQNIS